MPADAQTYGLSFMHTGATVTDLAAAMDEYTRLGVGPWAVSDPMPFSTYDAARAAVVPQPVRMAFGRMPGGGALELVEPAPTDPPSPQRRLLEQRAGINHVAYWCRDVAQTAGSLIAAGARVFTIAAPDADRAARVVREQGEAGLLASASACYLQLASGTIVELVAAAMYGAPLAAMFGPQINEILPRPGDIEA